MIGGYIVINRFAMQEGGIDWINSCGVANTYEEAYEIFLKEKESLLQSMPNYSKTIIKDENGIFHIQYGKEKDMLPVHRYIKVISMY